MTVFPNDFFSTNRINSDTALVLDIKMPYLSRLGLVNKSTFGFMDRLWIWLGMHTTCIEKISNLFAANVTHLRNPKKYSRSFLNKIIKVEKGVPGAERIETLACNLINFNAQVKVHNESLSWKNPFRKTAVKINEQFIEELFRQSSVLRIPPPIINPPAVANAATPTPTITPDLPKSSVLGSLTNWLWKIPQGIFGSQATIEKIAAPNLEKSAPEQPKQEIDQFTPLASKIVTPITPEVVKQIPKANIQINPAIPQGDSIKRYTSPNTNPPSKIHHFANTCHFATAINFIAALPPLLDIFQKSQASGAALPFKNALMPILQNQATGTTEISPADYQTLANTSRIGMMAEQNINGMQDAVENVDHFIEHFAPIPRKAEDITPEIRDRLNRYTSTISQDVTFGHTERGHKESYTVKEVPFDPTIDEINLTESELKQIKPVTYVRTFKPDSHLKVQTATYRTIHEVVNGRHAIRHVRENTFKSLDQCLTDYFKNTWADPYRMLVRTKATETEPSKCFEIEGTPFLSKIAMRNAPEVLMIRLNRESPNFQDPEIPAQIVEKVTDAITVPQEMTIAGQRYVLCSGMYHGGAHYSAMQKRQGKWYINDDIFGVSDTGVQDRINHGYAYGYIRQDIHAQMNRGSQ